MPVCIWHSNLFTYRVLPTNYLANLFNAFNNEAIRKVGAALERLLHSAAIAGLRSRVMAVEDPIAVKSYMESASKLV